MALMTAHSKRRRNFVIVTYSFLFCVGDSSPSHPQPQYQYVVLSPLSPSFVAVVGNTRRYHRSGYLAENNICHWRSLKLYSHDESTSLSDTRNNNPKVAMEQAEREFFVSDAQFVHLGPAARILTEEFYSRKTNFITFQIERLKTILSLESTYPNKQSSINTVYSKRSSSLQKMFVACDATNGKVVGFAEVNANSFRGGNDNDGVGNRDVGATAAPLQYSAENGKAPSNDEILRSYMYNLAVDKKWKRKGIASSLVRACEQFVMDAHSDSCTERRLYLRVRKCNHAAIALYESLGYREMEPEEIQLSAEDINRGSLEDGELLLYAKDLPQYYECTV